MYILNSYKKCQSMKSETLSLKTIINELDFKEDSYDSMRRLKKRRFFVACKQINRETTSSLQY